MFACTELWTHIRYFLLSRISHFRILTLRTFSNTNILKGPWPQGHLTSRFCRTASPVGNRHKWARQNISCTYSFKGSVCPRRPFCPKWAGPRTPCIFWCCFKGGKGGGRHNSIKHTKTALPKKIQSTVN